MSRLKQELDRELSGIRISEGRISVAVSIGGAVQEGASDMHDLIQQADVSMYRKKGIYEGT